MFASSRSVHGNHHEAAETSGRSAVRPRAARDGELPLFVGRRPTVGESPLLLRKSCGGDCTCAACRAKEVQLSQPGDALEREADAMAERVMRSEAGHDVTADHSVATPPAGAIVPASGHGLDAVTRAFMEPRFGARFDAVRIHDGAEAARRASDFSARAYTSGEHLVFGAGEYRPGSDSGRRLIAHELAHVVQGRHGRIRADVARTVNASTLSCPANKAGAGADPAARLESLDNRAQGLADSMARLGILAGIFNPATSTHAFDVAYQTRMGTPGRVGKKFRDRFSGKLFTTEEEAAKKEVEVIASRFSKVNEFLAGPITYKCRANGVSYTLGGCPGRCRSDEIAQACVPNDKRTLGICPAFWGLDDDNERAGTLIHEAAHARLDFSGHSHGSRAQRARNPACYESMVADIFGFPADEKCPPI